MARDISECCVLFNVMDPFSDSVHSGPHWQWAGSSIWWKYTEKKDICLWLCELDCMKTVHGLCVQVIVPCWNAGQCLSRSPVVLRACDEKEWILHLYSCDIIGQMLLVMLYKIHFLFSLYFGFCNSDIAVISAYVKLIPSQNVPFQKPVHKMSKKLIIVSHFLKIS